MDELFDYMLGLLPYVPRGFTRYMDARLPWGSRMFGLVGPRGVGKTTLFLQHADSAGSTQRTLYVTADHMYFSTHSLYETAREFNHMGGTELLVDEVHKYPNWSRELKMIYDGLPDLAVAFTGSSVLDVRRGEADLSRRAPTYLMQGLSFREFLAIVHRIEAPCLSLAQILEHGESIPGVAHPLPLFAEYLRQGYYPFAEQGTFARIIEQVVSQTLEVDIPLYAGMNTATGAKLKRLMGTIATLVPFKPNMTRLAGQIGVSRNNIEDYLGYMENAGMIARLRTGARGIGKLGKVEKIYLDNPNLMYALGNAAVDVGTLRETFFLNQTRVLGDVTSSFVSDFEIGGNTFEVGGRSKGQDQLAGVQHGYVVRDDIEHGYGNVIPLWAFGLGY